MGDTKNTSTWVEAEKHLHTKSVVVKASKDVENMKAGDYIESVVSINEKGQMVIKTWKNGDVSTQMTKYMKRKGDWDGGVEADSEDEEK